MAEEVSGDQGGKLELMCSRVGYAEKPSSAASVLADRGTLHPPQVSFLRGEKKEILLVWYWFPYLCSSLFLQRLFLGGASVPVLQMGSSRARLLESIAVLVFVRGDAKGLICKVALIDG
jgi:hypothetical protein